MAKYTNEDIIQAIKSSQSLKEALLRIGLKPAGGNYKTIKRKIKELNIETSHMKGQSYLKGGTHGWAKKTPTNEILVENCLWGGTSSSLRMRLIKEGYFERKCYNCNNTEWEGNAIPLELEHKNGNKFDNRIKNLTILCPNCHALTSTYRGRNRRKVYSCKTCGGRRSKRADSGLCKKCSNIEKGVAQRKVKRPLKEELKEYMSLMSMMKIGDKYGVSDNTVRKWAKQYGLI